MIEREAPDWITEEIVELIMEAKRKWPNSFRLRTIEHEHGVILHIDAQHFETFSIYEKIQIAEGVNELCAKMNEKMCPTGIEKW